MHAWYSTVAHRSLQTWRDPAGYVFFVGVDGKEVLATITLEDFDNGDLYYFPDKVYLGEFDPATQRTVRADSVPVTK